jgi:hypothetical protein
MPISPFKRAALFLLAVSAAASSLASDYGYRDGVVIPLGVPFYSRYRNYQVLNGTVSSDGKLALIYPKRAFLSDPKHLADAGLYVARLRPFTILTEISYDNIAFNHGDYEAVWAKDGSTLIFAELAKWGPDKVTVIPFADGKPGKSVDLVPEIEKKMQPSFAESHAEKFNDEVAFIFDADQTSNWTPANRKVEIDCTCTTDPKDMDPKRWTARFQGTWDIVKGRFLNFKIRRLPNPKPED